MIFDEEINYQNNLDLENFLEFRQVFSFFCQIYNKSN